MEYSTIDYNILTEKACQVSHFYWFCFVVASMQCFFSYWSTLSLTCFAVPFGHPGDRRAPSPDFCICIALHLLVFTSAVALVAHVPLLRSQGVRRTWLPPKCWCATRRTWCRRRASSSDSHAPPQFAYVSTPATASFGGALSLDARYWTAIILLRVFLNACIYAPWPLMSPLYHTHTLWHFFCSCVLLYKSCRSSSVPTMLRLESSESFYQCLPSV